MDQAVPRNQSTRGERSLRDRVQARRSRAQKMAATRSAIENGVSALREPLSTPRMAPPPAPHFTMRPKTRRLIDRLLEFAGNQPAGERKQSVAYLRGTPSHAAPPPVGLPAYVPASRDPFAPPGALPEPMQRRRRKRDPMPLPLFVPLALEFLVALTVVAALGFFIFTLSRGALNFAGIHIGGARASDAPVEAVMVEKPAESLPAAALPDQPVTILLMGSDRRAGDNGFRTDVMLLLTIDAKGGRVSAMSFPRDLIGKIPGYGDGRINIVMGQGGFEAVQGTFSDTYGVRPQYYFLINFESFVGLINSIGGIQIDAAQELEDSCDLYWSTAGVCRVEVGPREMDGDTALWYVRSRHSSSDFDRLRRAQEVMMGIFYRLLDMRAMTRIPELYAQYSGDVETNMGIPQILSLLPMAARVAQDTSLIQRFAVPESITADWFMPDGARVLLPDYDALRQLVKEATFQE